MDVRYLVLSLLFFISCTPTAQVSKGDLASTETTSGATSGSGSGAVPATAVSWNYLGAASNFITINVSNLNNAYIVGTPVENYLSDLNNFENVNYCLVSTYTLGGVRKELRSRIVPISYFDFKTKRTVKNFRVDFPDVQNSSSLCAGTLEVQDPSSGEFVTDSSGATDPNRFYNAALLCTNCTGMLGASTVRIFKKESSTTLEQVPPTFVTSDALALQVDPNFAISNGGGTCSNNDCVARGFNCCLDNQCVKDGSTKPAARELYSSLLDTAEQERLQNPLAYLNYPQLYYICGSSIPTPTTGGSTSGAGGSYDPAFQILKKDYKCVKHLKSQATVTPFHNQLLSRTWPATAECLTAAAEFEQEQYFQNVMKRLYTTCGCNRTELQDMINNCPAYEYTVVNSDTNNEPTRIDCFTPPLPTPNIPLQQSVVVPSRSAPHRFFDAATGTEKPIATGVEVEGTKFEYQDEGKVLPSQQPFSMNAILGQMSVSLDQALPAKTVNVELDQIYFVSTTSGFYTPCPTCAKDSWLSAFTAFPSASTGTGLQAVGHTTERDTFSTNTTSGNYEDTIFGRACWLPPTMIPYTHSPKSDSVTQRRNRLSTQAALFANGYQRDWFGFNKGALIGSFDGVSWFAIGKGRIVRSSSKKLFLAINAPFADVASPTTHTVRIQAYDGITQAAAVDYDPQYHQYHPFQNEAGNCQRYHFCATDTDCVTKLGWEYACADVKDVKTNWPEFDADGNEKANIALPLTIDQVLLQKKFPSSATKRCVYRGAGAVCHTNSAVLPATDLNKRKLLTCAPNFFCASTGASVHNNKIARYAAPLEDIPVARNHLFGKDANILGRPENYTGTAGLTSGIRSTINENVSVYEPTVGSATGICQPGKSLPTAATQATMSDPYNQHKAVDTLRRADFINQIGSCNSTLFTTSRHSSCPVIGADGNYEMFATGSILLGYERRASNQNSCGLESLLPTASLSSSADSLQSSSPFRTIEAKTLSTQIIVDGSLIRDACLRRAGSACHTDLDCSPNKLHASQADFFGTNFFGNIAEKNYYSEFLVCGQKDAKPLPSNTEAFKNYDITKNKCCREIGKDLTTYTADVPQDTHTSLRPYLPDSAGLNMSVAPGVTPNDPMRYSRLATVEGLGTTKPTLTANIDRSGSSLAGSNNLMKIDQWKTISEANSESCCGGGFIRKFSDGSNDWTRRDRVFFDVTNFACLNSRSIMLTHPEDAVGYNSATDAQTLVNSDYGDYCKDSSNTNGSCAQNTIQDRSPDIAPQSSGNYASVTIDTVKPDYKINNLDYYFKPRSADSNVGVIMDYNDTNLFARRNITIKIPSYITRAFDAAAIGNTASIRLVREDAIGYTCIRDPGFNPTAPETSYGPGPGFPLGIATCFYNYDSATRILKVSATNSAFGSSGLFDKKKVGVRFTTTVAGSGTPATVLRTKPGSSGFYLRRLGRIELTGIPQIAYESLECNDNSYRIVPGIFKPGINRTSDFSVPTFSFTANYTTKDPVDGVTNLPRTGRFTTHHGLVHEPVFSPNDFKCCSPLGSTVQDASKCCSGFGLASAAGSNDNTCALPPGTDLMVYFNRFVSNEGTGTTQPGGGLTEADFEAQTGEPLLTTTVNDKIRALGNAYCSSGSTRQGGALGLFEIEPQGSDTKVSDRIYNFVDSSRDFAQASNAGSAATYGYNAFMDGFRWNHHLYCSDGM